MRTDISLSSFIFHLSLPSLPACPAYSLLSCQHRDQAGQEVQRVSEMRRTNPPDRYVPIDLVLGPTSNLGRSNLNTRRGSYDAWY